MLSVFARLGGARRSQAAKSRQAKRAPLNCRVELTKQEKDDSVFDAFGVEICGSIPTRRGTDYATLKVSIMDVTDGVA